MSFATVAGDCRHATKAWERRAFVVHELARSHVFRLYRANPSHCVGLTIHGFPYSEGINQLGRCL